MIRKGANIRPQKPKKHFIYPKKHARIPYVNKVISFIKEAVDELKASQWPTKQQTVRLTGLLVAISFGMGLFVTLFDYIFKELLAILVK